MVLSINNKTWDAITLVQGYWNDHILIHYDLAILTHFYPLTGPEVWRQGWRQFMARSLWVLLASSVLGRRGRPVAQIKALLSLYTIELTRFYEAWVDVTIFVDPVCNISSVLDEGYFIQKLKYRT